MGRNKLNAGGARGSMPGRQEMRGGWEVGVIWMVLLGLCLRRPHWSKDLSGGREAALDVQEGEPSMGHPVPTLRKHLLGLLDGR